MKTSLEVVSQHPDYQLLKRVATHLPPRVPTDSKHTIATIIDLETMGLNAKSNEIIEIGMLSFSFSSGDGILAITDTYNALQDPNKPIPVEVTQVTGITAEQVKGKSIDWDVVAQLLEKTQLIICHNSGFDRNFLELQTPDSIAALVKGLPFACTIQDINWKKRGIDSSKLDYINWKLGFFYDGHRALNDCWATLNILMKSEGAFDELKTNALKNETLICATNAPFNKKDVLKGRNYHWSDGSAHLPKCWWICVKNECLLDEKQWLDKEIYGTKGKSEALPQMEITARHRYSFRATSMQSELKLENCSLSFF